jgi:prepilin-type N-terminal cleavage/methylation domain-containing protein
MNKAFTLVELAIVIVIIGLLVGGVLQGQELIAQAKIRSQIKQLAEYDTAILTFRGKYDGLPADINRAKATKFGFTAAGPTHIFCNDENGLITDSTGNLPPLGAFCEPLYFLRDLSIAKLVKDTFPRTGNQYAVGIQFPVTKMGNGGFLYASLADGGLYAYLGLIRKDDDGTNTNVHQINLLSATPLFTAEESFQLDEKMDNGNPLTGKVKAVTNSLTPDTAANACITNTTDQTYNITDNTLRCRLVVRTSI